VPGVRAEVRRVRREVVGEFARNDLLTYSSAIAFQVLYAVAPLAMLALAGLSLVGERSVYTEHIAPALHHHVSPQAFTIANRTAARVMGSERWWWTTLGVAITIWGVSASLRAMTTPLNAIYDARDNRSWARRIAVSIGAGVIVIVCVLTALGVVLGGRLVHPSGAAAAVAFFLLRWLVALALLLTTIAVVLRAVPAKKRPVRWVTLGSLLAAVCWIGATVGFGAYISAVSYATFYGGLGSVILLLVYLHVSAIAFLLGVTVDASLREEVTRTKGRRRRGRSRTPVGT
jgi:membrane protein